MLDIDRDSSRRLRVFSLAAAPSGIREFTPHCHPELEICMIKRGSGVFSVVGRKYEICPGDIFMFASNEQHKITYVDPSEEMLLTNIHFLPQYMFAASSDLGSSDCLRVFFARGDDYSNKLDVNNPAFGEISSLLCEVEREMNDRAVGYELLARLNLMKALALTRREYGITPDNDTDECYYRKNVKRMENVLSYIDENISRDISLDDLCRVSGMSRASFSNIFKRFTGTTSSAYITSRRVAMAVDMLRTTDLSVLEIAFSCGFHNTANFNRAFKAHIGCSPTDVRSGFAAGLDELY